MSGAIIGSLMGDYLETFRSGTPGRTRYFDASAYGWMQRHTVTVVYLCFKRNVQTVIDALDISPDQLITTGGSNNDGSSAGNINWGGGYILYGVNPQQVSPSMTELTSTYVKEIPDAQVNFPTNLTVECAAGVYTVKWMGVTKKTFDNGLGYCGPLGLEFVKISQKKNEVLVTQSAWSSGTGAVGSNYSQKFIETRWYDRLEVRIDGSAHESYRVISRKQRKAWVDDDDGKSYGASFAGKRVTIVNNSTETLDEATVSPTYASNLRWEVSRANCSLYWAGTAIWNFNYP